jgi:DNA-binding CsgD family transcriptional regulator
VETYWLLRKAREFDRVAEASLDALPHPVWVVRKDARFDHANAAAVRLMAANNGWVRCVGHRIVSLGQFGEHDLGGCVAAAGAAAASPLVCTRSHGKHIERATLHVMAIAGDNPFARAWPAARALLTLELFSDELTDKAWYDRVAQHYQLTPAEQRILLRLVEGQSPKQMAEELCVTVATVRTHVQTLLFKTTCRRQIDLLRLVLGR